jgi:hypothetical protein
VRRAHSEQRLEQQDHDHQADQEDDANRAAEELDHATRIAAGRGWVCKGIGSREWDRTTGTGL